MPANLDEPAPGTMHLRNPQSGIPGMGPLPLPPQAPLPPMMQVSKPVPPTQQPLLPQQPAIAQIPTPPPGNWPVWPGWGVQPQQATGGTSPDPVMDRSMVPPAPQRVAGPGPNVKKSRLYPWMLIVGALVMAALAFAITRAFITG
ncbi:MAG: hypothetical protein LH654_05655 [Thermoleophilia bacterium]|nr:hypothetical protein [Thermoleophilia bacterium]